MAMTYSRASDVVREIASCCNDVRSLTARIDALKSLNLTTQVDWGANPIPEVLEVDQDGNLLGFKFDRQQLANAIDSLIQIRRLLNNEAPEQNGHLARIEAVADVPVRYPI